MTALMGEGGVAGSGEAKRASWLGTLLTWIDVVFWLLVAVFPTIVVGLLGPLFGDRQRWLAHRILAGAFRAIVRVHPTIGVRITGVEHLTEGPAILCPNHQSLSDVVFLFGLPGQIRWVIKRELFRVPLFGLGMWAAGYLSIDRGDPRSAIRVLADARKSLEAGVSILTFPEGTRSATGELGPFNSGPARLAIASGVPLIPIGVAGTRWILPKGAATYPGRGQVAIHIGAPIRSDDVPSARALTRRLREAVVQARAEAEHSLARPETRG